MNGQIEPTQSPPHHVSKKWMFLGVFGAIIAIVGLTFYALGKSNTSFISAPKPTSTSVVQPTSASDETANWKTYTNMKYRFRFKYPQTLTPWADVIDESMVILDSLNKATRIDLYFQQNPTNASLEEILKGEERINTVPTDYLATEKVLIGNAEAMKIKYKGRVLGTGRMREDYSIKIKGNGLILTFWIRNFIERYASVNAEDIRLLDQILSTFKFLDQN